MAKKGTSFFDRLRSRRSVLKRTRKRDDLPEVVLYLEWIGGEAKRRVMAPDGSEHVFADAVIESNYKSASKQEAEKLIEAYWKKEIAQPQEPVRNPTA